MNLNEIIEHTSPFKHWEFQNILDNDALNEISYSNIPDGNRVYDGTRAADHSGKGVDGKLRLFITKENNHHFLKAQESLCIDSDGNKLDIDEKDKCIENNNRWILGDRKNDCGICTQEEGKDKNGYDS